MEASKLLKAQHREVKGLFERIESTSDEQEKSALFEELGSSLVAHDAIEREIFYPACEEEFGLTDRLGESLVEHGLVEFSLYQADLAFGSEDFKFKCAVLKEMLEHHIEEEEKELIPQVEKAFDSERLEELGEEMEERFEQAKEKDFRAALLTNLQQVMGGATKTHPEPTGGKKAPRTSDGREAHPRGR